MIGFGFDGTERPLRDALVAISSCTLLAFALTAIIDRSGIMRRNGSRRLRPNARTPFETPYVVELVEDRGDWFGRVVVGATGAIVFETMREPSASTARRKAEARQRSLERSMRASIRQASGPSRTTSSGTVLRLIPSPSRKK